MRIRKANADDAAAAWEIRRGAILDHCRGHYPAEKLAKWTEGQFDEGFIRFVVEELYVTVEEGQVVATGMIDRSPAYGWSGLIKYHNPKVKKFSAERFYG